MGNVFTIPLDLYSWNSLVNETNTLVDSFTLCLDDREKLNMIKKWKIIKRILEINVKKDDAWIKHINSLFVMEHIEEPFI